MRQRSLSVGGWLAGWLVSPATAWAVLTGAIALIWATIAGLPAVVVALVALAALTLGVVLAHYILRLREHLKEPEPPPENPHAPTGTGQGSSAVASPQGRVYGGGAVGAAIRQHATREIEHAVFLAAEAEIALAREEALEMAKMLRKDWPHITPDGAVVEVSLPDWRSKNLDFIGVILGAGRRAAFKAAGAVGSSALESLEAEGAFLDSLTSDLTLDAIRVTEAQFLDARRERRSHEAASFLNYDHSHAPSAPPLPEETDDMGFGRRDDRAELAQRCHMLAGSIEKWVENTKQQEGPVTAKMAEEWLEDDAGLEPAEAVRLAHARYEKTREADYRLKYEGEAQKLFREAWELHEVAKEHERLAVQPLAIEFERVPRLFNKIAERLYAIKQPDRGK